MVLSEAQSALWDSEIEDLIRKGAVIPASIRGFISSVFVIPKSSGGFRPIINLKNLNQYVVYRHFKMESWPEVRSLVRHGDWFVKVDLTDAYLTIPIHPLHQSFLQLQWRNALNQFRCLPFGLSSAPWAFTKILKPLLSFFRSRGVRLVVYLDDFLLINSCQSNLLKD